MHHQVPVVGGLQMCYPREWCGTGSSFLPKVADQFALWVKAVDSACQHTAVIVAPQGLLVRQGVGHKKGLVVGHCYLRWLNVWERDCSLVGRGVPAVFMHQYLGWILLLVVLQQEQVAIGVELHHLGQAAVYNIEETVIHSHLGICQGGKLVVQDSVGKGEHGLLLQLHVGTAAAGEKRQHSKDNDQFFHHILDIIVKYYYYASSGDV